MTFKKLTPYLLTFLGLNSLIQAATIIDNFESGLGGWTQVGTGSGVFGTAAGNGSTTAATIDWNGSNQGNPGAYLVNSGVAFDATQTFSGTFDFFLPENGNDMRVNFIVGDIQNGITGTAGEFLNFYGNERTFGRRAQLRDGAGTILFDGDGNNQYRIDTNNWITASFSWTPTSGTTGDFSISWTYPAQPNRGPMTTTGYTFTSNEVYFGFGTGQPSTVVSIDNINITGTAIPEPSVALLGGLGTLLLLRRRNR